MQMIRSLLLQSPSRAHFKNAISVVFSMLLFSGVALGQKAAAPVKPVEEEKHDDLEAIVLAKLNTIIIPLVIFEDTKIEEAIDFLRVRSWELDLNEKKMENRGFRFVIRKPHAAFDEANGPKICSLQLHNVPLVSVLKYICLLTNHHFYIDEGAIVISPKTEGAKEALIPVNQVAREELIKRLNAITIPQVDFNNVSIDEAVNSLLSKSRWRDPQNKEAINFVVGQPIGDKKTVIKQLQMKEATLYQVLKSMCEAVGYDFTVDDAAVILIPQKK